MCTKAERVGRLAAGSTPHRVVVRTGSTPHVRGKLLGVGVQVVHVGLNPTYAGKTRAYPRDDFSRQAKPHICGEDAS